MIFPCTDNFRLPYLYIRSRRKKKNIFKLLFLVFSLFENIYKKLFLISLKETDKETTIIYSLTLKNIRKYVLMMFI